MMTKRLFAVMAAAITFFAVSPGFAADSTASKTTNTATETAETKSKEVGYCSKCDVYYSAADTKAMKMMDAQGHQLVMTPLSKVPKSAELGHIGMKEPRKKHRT